MLPALLTARWRRGVVVVVVGDEPIEKEEDIEDEAVLRFRVGDMKDDPPPPPPPADEVEAPEENEASMEFAVGDLLTPPPVADFRHSDGVLRPPTPLPLPPTPLPPPIDEGVGDEESSRRSSEDAEEERRFCLALSAVGDVGDANS